MRGRIFNGKAAPQVRQHFPDFLVLVHASSTPAQPHQLRLHTGIGKLRFRQHELALQLQLVDHLLLLRRDHELRLQSRGAAQDRLLGVDRKLQQIFDATLLHVHVDFYPAPGHALEPDDRAVRDHRRVEKRRIHLFQVGIAVGAIDDGGEACLQRNGRTSRVDLELRRVRRPLNLDAVDGTVEVSRRAQHAREPLNGVEIRVVEGVFSGDRGARRMRRRSRGRTYLTFRSRPSAQDWSASRCTGSSG